MAVRAVNQVCGPALRFSSATATEPQCVPGRPGTSVAGIIGVAPGGATRARRTAETVNRRLSMYHSSPGHCAPMRSTGSEGVDGDRPVALVHQDITGKVAGSMPISMARTEVLT